MSRVFRLALAASATLALTTLVCIASRAAPAVDAGSADLEALFRAQSFEIELADGALTGPGAGFLSEQASNAQFVCIGEPHNVHDIPPFVTALFSRLQDEHGFHYLAIEQGPLITARIAELSSSKDDQAIRKFARKRRKALHFRTAEEVQMIASVARMSEGTVTGVWGLDRVLAPRFVDEYLATASGDSALDSEFVAERAAWSADNLEMYRSGRRDEEGPSPDQHREDGFKTGFHHFYDRAAERAERPVRVLFRFGHVHMGRLERTNWNRLGYHVRQMAESQGLESFHLNIQLINRPGKYWSLTEYPEYEPLTSVGDPEKWVIVDLRPARELIRSGRVTVHDKLLKLVFDFDAVLLMGGGSRGQKL